jgi:hypothetical protein
MIIANRDILLEVAAEIEAYVNYSGADWWCPDTQCGCAIVRTLGKVTELKQSPRHQRSVVFDIKDDAGHRIVDPVYAVALVTGLSDIVWNEFCTFSLDANRFETAAALRYIHRTGDFDTHEFWKEYNQNNPAGGEENQ